MSIIITRGYSWGSTELVTNTKLHTLIDSATIDMSAPSAIGGTTPAAGAFTTLTATGLLTLTSGQLAFPASQSASADPNTIDDYEEGYFTPTITGDSGNYVLATSADTFYYIKISKMVFFQGYLAVASDNSASGDIKISIPFAAANLSDKADITIVNACIVDGGGTIPNPYGLILGPTSVMCLRKLTDAGVETYITDSDVDAVWTIRVSGSYVAAN